MKYFNKKFLILFLILTGTLFLFNAPSKVWASSPPITNPFNNLNVTIPGLDKISAQSAPTCQGTGDNQSCKFPWIAQYIAAIYNYAIGIVGIVAVIVMMVGGFLWLTAGGNAGQITEAQNWIKASVVGLVIALSSYVILDQISPALVFLKPITVGMVQPLSQVEQQYAQTSCSSLTDAQKQSGISALITGYCQPTTTTQYGDTSSARHDFLCQVGLNCSCPSGTGRNGSHDCSNSKGFTWSSCNDFDNKNVPYCQQTASGGSPTSGSVAADWSCFPKLSNICINGQTYTVTDKGSAITGSRIDVWTDNCAQAYNITGTYIIKEGACQ